MEISFWHQLLLPFLSLAFGLIAGVLYDVVRIFRCCLGIKYTQSAPKWLSKIKLPLLSSSNKEKRMGAIKENIIMGITDILYFLILTVLMCIFVYAVNNGKIRWYIYVFSLLGFLIYYFTVGKLVIKVSSVASFIIRSMFSYIVLFLFAPVRSVSAAISRKISERKKKRISEINESESIRPRNIVICCGKDPKQSLDK